MQGRHIRQPARQAARSAGGRRPAQKGAHGPARRDAARPGGIAPPTTATLDHGAIVRLQSLAGNQAVGQLLAQPRLSVQTQAAACPPAPPPPAPVAPHDDPKFVAVTADVKREGVKQKQHPPAKAKANEAAAAAAGPSNDVASKAAAAQVDDMSQQKPKGFDKPAFIAAVHEAIAKATPKNMEEVDDFSKSGKAGQMKEQVVGKVGQGREEAAKAIKTTSDAPPNTGGVAPKPVTPMQPESPGAAPADVRAGDGMPRPVPAEQVSLEHGTCETDSDLKDNNVTREQVAKSNEPQFQDAMTAKDKADEHAATAPGQFRQQEQGVLGQAQGQAGGATAAGLSQMHQGRAGVLGQVAAGKDAAKTKNEAERARVATELESIYGATKKDVDGILQGLDAKVTAAFDSGEKAARDAFENAYKTKKDAYFDDRYSGLLGPARWLKDKLTSPPPEVNQFIEQAKQLYLTRMEQVINSVADIVERELTAATTRIQDGRRQIKEYVAKQPKELQQVAQEAAGGFESKFDELDQAVTDKSSAIVDDLAQKYVAAAQAVDERCNAMREENKGLLDRAKDAISGMIETLKKMKEMLAALAAKAAGVVDQILQDPIGFLGNLIGAVKQGLDLFVGNIGKHLQEGLMGWLLGELADAGITMPESFDLKGILSLVAQVLGLTWANFRSRAAKLLGEPVVAMIEQGADVFQKIVHIFETIKTEGIAGLWHLISDKIGDLQSAVIDQIKDFVITKVITAGVTWIISLLNPASAFVKACKAIYDIVMFFIERGSQIMALVNAILDNLAAIAGGNLSAAAALVESVLAKGLPVAISFLASLLGLGGISEKIKEIINAVRKPINKAVDWVLKSVVAPVAKVAGKAIAWAKGKVKAGVDWVKKKGRAAVDKIKSKFRRDSTGNDARSPAEKQVAVDSAVRDVEGLMAVPGTTRNAVAKALPAIKKRYGLNQLKLVDSGPTSYHAHAALNPEKDSKDEKDDAADGMVAAYRGIHFKSTWSAADYDRQLRQNLVGQPTFSAAARELAGSKTPDGSDVSDADKLAAAQLVQDRVKQTKDPTSVRQWWGGKKQVFDSLYLALLQRYVNTYDAFTQELKNPDFDKIAGGGGLGFTTIPFISTTKKPAHAAAYAKGEKFIEEAEKRKTGIVGRVFVYLFSLMDLKAQDPANVEKLNDGKIKVKARIIQEGEIAFTGSIPGENLVSQHDASATQATAAVADTAKKSAESLASGKGGLKDW